MTVPADPTVLVVDDNESIAEMYASFLDDEYTVWTANDGHEALNVLDGSVDVVLLDRRMPSLSGDEVLARIQERGLDCRVVMVTAAEPTFDIVDMSFDEYLVKPVDHEGLRAVVDEMLQRATHDDAFRKFLALASKKGALEREKNDAALAESDEYTRMKRRLAEKRAELGIETADLEGVLSGDVPDITDSTDGDATDN